MPYIPEESRKRLEYITNLIDDVSIDDPGELNYLISVLFKSYIRSFPRLSYGVINDIVGATNGAMLEFYRHVVAPYEDKKIKENGDVYDNEK